MYLFYWFPFLIKNVNLYLKMYLSAYCISMGTPDWRVVNASLTIPHATWIFILVAELYYSESNNNILSVKLSSKSQTAAHNWVWM